MTDNADVERTLLHIRRLALGHYPVTFIEGDPPIDLGYCAALGLIAGIASEALLAVRQNRKPHFLIVAKEATDDQGSGD